MPIASVIFLQNDQGRAVVDALTHTDGVVVHGATQASIAATLDYLAQWDAGEYHDLGSVTRAGALDDRYQMDHNLLTWNTRLGSVGLEVILDDDTHEPSDVTTCRGCEQPIDYCLDHTHDTDWADEYDRSDQWRADYDATMKKLEASA